MPGISRRTYAIGVALLALTFLSVFAYWRELFLPLISDDYLVIGLSRDFGPVSRWGALLSDALYRNRATSMVLTWWIHAAFGLAALPYNLINLIFHIVNSWLILAFGVFPRIGWWRAAVAAAFFAVYEGHQEAVVWFSALPELLVFCFGLLALWCWTRWLTSAEHAWGWLAATWIAYLLALFSKESAVALLPVFGLVWWVERVKMPFGRAARGLLPLALMTFAYALLVFAGQQQNHHFRDGTFSLRAPFWLTILNSTGRLFWVWGLLSVLLLAWLRPQGGRRFLLGSLLWIVLTLLPYSFVTYQPRVPSRHTYLPSAGLAVIVSAGLLALYQRSRRAALAMAAVILVHNCGYLAFYKHPQYVKRARPTEELIRLGMQATGPIYLKSWPYSRSIAEYTLELGAGKPRNWLLFDHASRDKALYTYSWDGDI